MKTLQKTSLALAIGALAIASPYTHAVEYSLSGELAVELTDNESEEDAGLDVTTTDLELTITESFGDVEVEGFIAYELEEDDNEGLQDDGKGITVSGAFGSVFVGDDGSGAWVGEVTDVLYNNSEAFFEDPTTNVIDYGLPLSGPFSLNIFVDVTEGDEEDIDASGLYGSVELGGFTVALGYTNIADDGAYGGDFSDDIIDFATTYESDAFSAGIGYQESEVADEDWEVLAAFASIYVGNVTITPYYEELENGDNDNDVTALNVAYNFTENFYIFFETASYDDDDDDNSEIGLVLTF